MCYCFSESNLGLDFERFTNAVSVADSYWRDQIDENEIVGAWGTRKIHVRFFSGNLEEGDNLKDLDIDDRIILTWVLKK
jgi:hypothetical protein